MGNVITSLVVPPSKSPGQLYNNFQQDMESSIYHTIGPSLKRIVACCDATGLLIPSLHEVLNWPECKLQGIVSDLDLRRAIQREKHISNFLYEHLAKQYTQKKRFLGNIAVLVDLLKFGDTTVREDSNTVFVNDLKLIESQQLEWRTFRPLQLSDLNAVLSDIKNLDLETRDALDVKLQTHNLNIRSLANVDNMPGWSQLYFSSRIEPSLQFTDKKSHELLSSISLLTGIKSQNVIPYLKGARTALVADNKNRTPTVLFLGLTGSGKSTLINHLLGVTYHDREQVVSSSDEIGLNSELSESLSVGHISHKRKTLRTDQTEFAKVGHSSAPQTVFPESFVLRDGDASLVLCDCPGLDTAGNETSQLCADLNLPAVLTHIESVGSLVLVISWSDLFDQRGRHLGVLLRQIGRVLAGAVTSDYHRSIFYVFTKVPVNITKGRLNGVLQGFIDDARKHVGISGGADMSLTEYDWAAQLIILMLLSPEQVELFHDDGGDIASRLSSRLFAAPRFDCGVLHNTSEKNAVLQKVASGVSEIISTFESYKHINSKLDINLRDLSIQFADAKARTKILFDTMHGGREKVSSQASLVMLDNALEEKQTTIVSIQRGVEAKISARELLIRELVSLNSDEEEVCGEFDHSATNMWFYTTLKHSLKGALQTGALSVAALPVPLLQHASACDGAGCCVALENVFHRLIAVNIHHQFEFPLLRVEASALHGSIKQTAVDSSTNLVLSPISGCSEYCAVFYPCAVLMDLSGDTIEFHAEDRAHLRFFAKRCDIHAQKILRLTAELATLEKEITHDEADLALIGMSRDSFSAAMLSNNHTVIMNSLERDTTDLKTQIDRVTKSIKENFEYLNSLIGQTVVEAQWFTFLHEVANLVNLPVMSMVSGFSENFLDRLNNYRSTSAAEYEKLLSVVFLQQPTIQSLQRQTSFADNASVVEVDVNDNTLHMNAQAEDAYLFEDEEGVGLDYEEDSEGPDRDSFVDRELGLSGEDALDGDDGVAMSGEDGVVLEAGDEERKSVKDSIAVMDVVVVEEEDDSEEL